MRPMYTYRSLFENPNIEVFFFARDTVHLWNSTKFSNLFSLFLDYFSKHSTKNMWKILKLIQTNHSMFRMNFQKLVPVYNLPNIKKLLFVLKTKTFLENRPPKGSTRWIGQRSGRSIKKDQTVRSINIVLNLNNLVHKKINK